MTRSPCPDCNGRAGAHYGWCHQVGGPGRRPSSGPSWSARLGHLEAPTSTVTLAANTSDVVVATTAILCPACLGDWCEACDWTGLARPVEPAPALAVVHSLPVPAAHPAAHTEAAA